MLTRSPIIPNIANVPSGVFDGNQDWKPDCEMWLKSKMCFDVEVPGIDKDDRYQDNAGEREFNKLRQKLGEDF